MFVEKEYYLDLIQDRLDGEEISSGNYRRGGAQNVLNRFYTDIQLKVDFKMKSTFN